jgi:5-methylcytosine-specific restriction enzyme B
LLGFPNALEPKKYVKPDNRTLDLIIEASKEVNIQKPYFLILDEMNLSHVERYFADFLSVMESQTEISLHPGNEDWDDVPAKIGFPPNLFIVGTVNIDETTYMFSPKVLDRANVIEFRVAQDEMDSYLKNNKYVNLNNLKGLGADMSGSFLEIAGNKSLKSGQTDELNDTLISFFSELKKTGAEFGYRSASEIMRFAAVVNKIETAWTMSEIIDAAIMQKLLPKVHGSRKKLKPVLETLGELCLNGKIAEGDNMENYLNNRDGKDVSGLIKYPISFDKISRMYKNLLDNGFTSYSEA